VNRLPSVVREPYLIVTLPIPESRKQKALWQTGQNGRKCVKETEGEESCVGSGRTEGSSNARSLLRALPHPHHAMIAMPVYGQKPRCYTFNSDATKLTYSFVAS
jgi:hypothetical protein